MPGTACGLVVIDLIVRPFAKIVEKMPLLMLLVLIILYAIIAYFVLRSAYASGDYR